MHALNCAQAYVPGNKRFRFAQPAVASAPSPLMAVQQLKPLLPSVAFCSTHPQAKTYALCHIRRHYRLYSCIPLTPGRSATLIISQKPAAKGRLFLQHCRFLCPSLGLLRCAMLHMPDKSPPAACSAVVHVWTLCHASPCQAQAYQRKVIDTLKTHSAPGTTVASSDT